ncbi:MAG TPA: FAD-dependent oxidoreductase [Sphingobium sp.]|uniref:FAD-dependent oxidoreductase n=1 Tax=Sphingobium sp. TaxID=1912891 RepID=UPI002ECFBAD9
MHAERDESIERRNFLKGSGVAIAAAASIVPLSVRAVAPDPIPVDGDTVPGPKMRQRSPLAPIRASMDRVIFLESCLRPFRPQGPRIELEKVGTKSIIHNYGHGGSGWSLSWGSGRQATRLAKQAGARQIAVIGAGAIGLTTAVVAQRAGFKVRIYTKDMIPNVRSARATGVWSPSARIVALEHATPAFRKLWEEMARYSYAQYNALLGVPGNPVEWIDTYKMSDTPFAKGASLYTHAPYPNEPEYPHLEEEHTPDLMSAMQELTKEQHPFPVDYVRRMNTMMFNIPAHAQGLLQDFLARGGEVVIREFESPKEFQELPEKTIIHSTGYAAKALLGDNSMVPVRGQTAKMIPQPEVDYAISYDSQNFYTVPRRDGMIVQEWSPGDYGNEKEVAYIESTRASVDKLAKMMAAMSGKS